MSLSSFSSMGKYLNVSAGGSSGGGSVPSTGLVLYSGYDADVNDHSASAISVANTGCTINSSSQKVGTGCLSFGINNYLKFSSAIPFGSSYGSCFSFWMNLTTMTLGTNNSSSNQFIEFMGYLPLLISINKKSSSTYTIATTIYGAYPPPETATLNINTWYHVVYNFGGTSASPLLTLYINNAVSGTQNSTSLSNFKYAPVGSSNWSGYNLYSWINNGDATAFGLNSANFTGYVDALRVYNRALTTGEVTALYNET